MPAVDAAAGAATGVGMRGAFSAAAGAAGGAAAGTADETGRAGATGVAGTGDTAGTAAGARACAGFAENRLGSARAGAGSTGASDDRGGDAICGCCIKGAGVDGAGTGIGVVAGPWSCGVSLDFFLKKLNIDTLAGRDGSASRLVGWSAGQRASLAGALSDQHCSRPGCMPLATSRRWHSRLQSTPF